MSQDVSQDVLSETAELRGWKQTTSVCVCSCIHRICVLTGYCLHKSRAYI
eukprot:m.542360 g.542360  ORF g.542360 m.542360 type:complete len:50 (+) comp22118_c0_seq1:37-186(+)